MSRNGAKLPKNASLCVLGVLLVIGAWPIPCIAGGVDGVLVPGVKQLAHAARDFWAFIGPGGTLHPAYFLEHKGHIVVEALLLAIICYLFLQHSFKPRAKSEDSLTEREIDQLCREWQPEPLVPSLPEHDVPKSRLISGYDGKYIIADGCKALNLATFNFLNLSGTAEQLSVAHAAVDKYGVGSCGPRGFYGTIDVHLQLEAELAQFMGTAQAIMYSYDIATVSSIIPAFANRKDTLVVDECCAFPIQQGAVLSRASLHYFKHNDMADLERILQAIEVQERKDRKPLTRRMIVVEGIYSNTGELAPLTQLLALKNKYKYRLLVEESNSFGVLGKTGRGATEHWGVDPGQVDVVCASLGNSLGSVGGFCVGTEETVEHQRLSGSGYCFSASLPPYLAVAASSALATLKTSGAPLLARLRSNAGSLRRELRQLAAFKLVEGPGTEVSPLIHLHLTQAPKDRAAAQALLQRIADHALHKSGVLVAVPQYAAIERTKPRPSIRLCCSSELEDADITAVASALKAAARSILG
ncbi:pyridoxal phosphate-dependent transferase [Haematococcus lacustris]